MKNYYDQDLKNPLLQTKTFWAGLLSIIGGVFGLFTNQIDQSTSYQLISQGITAIFLRDAISKI